MQSRSERAWRTKYEKDLVQFVFYILCNFKRTSELKPFLEFIYLTLYQIVWTLHILWYCSNNFDKEEKGNSIPTFYGKNLKQKIQFYLFNTGKHL